MVVISRLLMAFALSFIWMVTTGYFSLEGFGVGLVISFVLITILNWRGIGAKLRLTPDTIVALVIYGLMLFRDIFWSSMDVAWRIVQPKIPLNAGIVAVPTFETHEAIVAMSAHGITITPGQIVVDFESDDIMYIHCLDTNAAVQTLEADQQRRLKYLRRIWGESAVREDQPSASISSSTEEIREEI